MAKITRSRRVAADMSDVWDVLADFGSIGAWADNVDHSRLLTRAAGGEPVGTTRRVQVGRNALVERITRLPNEWRSAVSDRPDIVILMTDEERAVPPYESTEVLAWRQRQLLGRRWFDEHGVNSQRHYTGSLSCVPSRPTLFTGHYPDLHGVTQTDGISKTSADSRMRWLRAGEVPTLGNWFRAAGYDTHYDGKWHISHADLFDESGKVLAANDVDGVVGPAAVPSTAPAVRSIAGTRSTTGGNCTT